MAKVSIGGRGRMKSQLSPEEQREVNRLWRVAKQLSKVRLAAARMYGCDSSQAREAWIAEDKAWSKAIPVGGY
jgi:hypothetical protein